MLTLRRHAPWVLAVASVIALVLAGAVGLTTDPNLDAQRLSTNEIGWWLAYLVFALVGAIVATRRPDNRVGWLMLAAGAFNCGVQAVTQYGVWTLVRHPGSLPGGSVASWVTSFLWTPSVSLMVLVLAYFPDGHLQSRRWRWLPALVGTCTTIIVVVTAVDMWPRRGASLMGANGAYEHGTATGVVIGVLWPFIPISAVAAMVGLALRYRRSSGIQRQQLKWIVLAALVSAPMIVATEVHPKDPSPVVSGVMQLLNSPMWVALGIGLAVLRYRLYDIDRIVSRTVTYAVLTAVLVGSYVGLVALTETVLGFSSGVAVAASTLAAAAAFQPLRRRVQRAIDRRFDRAAYDARRTADAFAQRLRDEVDVDAVCRDLVGTVDAAIAPESVSLWLARA